MTRGDRDTDAQQPDDHDVHRRVKDITVVIYEEIGDTTASADSSASMSSRRDVWNRISGHYGLDRRGCDALTH